MRTRRHAMIRAAGKISMVHDYKRETPISILADVFGTDAPGTTAATPGEYFKTVIRAVYPVSLSCPLSPFSSFLLARSCRASRSFASSASPGRERNDARVGPDDKCRAIMRQVVSKVSAETSGCNTHAGYHQRDTAAVSSLGNKHSRLSFMRHTARPRCSIVLRNLERSMWAIKMSPDVYRYQCRVTLPALI